MLLTLCVLEKYNFNLCCDALLLCDVQISQAFKPEKDDVEYAQGTYMLQMLGLQVRLRCCYMAGWLCNSSSMWMQSSNYATQRCHSTMML